MLVLPLDSLRRCECQPTPPMLWLRSDSRLVWHLLVGGCFLSLGGGWRAAVGGPQGMGEAPRGATMLPGEQRGRAGSLVFGSHAERGCCLGRLGEGGGVASCTPPPATGIAQAGSSGTQGQKQQEKELQQLLGLESSRLSQPRGRAGTRCPLLHGMRRDNGQREVRTGGHSLAPRSQIWGSSLGKGISVHVGLGAEGSSCPHSTSRSEPHGTQHDATSTRGHLPRTALHGSRRRWGLLGTAPPGRGGGPTGEHCASLLARPCRALLQQPHRVGAHAGPLHLHAVSLLHRLAGGDDPAHRGPPQEPPATRAPGHRDGYGPGWGGGRRDPPSAGILVGSGLDLPRMDNTYPGPSVLEGGDQLLGWMLGFGSWLPSLQQCHGGVRMPSSAPKQPPVGARVQGAGPQC